MRPVPAGKYSPVAGNGLKELSEIGIRGKPFSNAYIVDILEEIRGIDVLVDHHPPQGGPVLAKRFLPEFARPFFFIAQPHFQVISDALDHQIEDPQRFRIESIVKIES